MSSENRRCVVVTRSSDLHVAETNTPAGAKIRVNCVLNLKWPNNQWEINCGTAWTAPGPLLNFILTDQNMGRSVLWTASGCRTRWSGKGAQCHEAERQTLLWVISLTYTAGTWKLSPIQNWKWSNCFRSFIVSFCFVILIKENVLRKKNKTKKNAFQ